MTGPVQSHLMVLGAGGPSPLRAPLRPWRARVTGVLLLSGGLALAWVFPRQASRALAGSLALGGGAAVVAGRKKRRIGDSSDLPMIMFGKRGAFGR